MFKTSQTPNSATVPDGGYIEYESATGKQEHILGAAINNAISSASAAAVVAAIAAVYPVGSVYVSIVSTSPATLFGGTWTAIGAGRTLVGLDSGDTDFDTAEETGGTKTHALTEAELPSHAHNADHNHTASSANDGNHRHTVSTIPVIPGDVTVGSGYNAAYSSNGNSGYAGTHNHAITVDTETMDTGSAGSDTAHTIVQPYLVVYMWKRTG